MPQPRVLISLILLTLLLAGCKPNRFDINTEDVKIEPVKILRLDQDVFNLTPQTIAAKTPELEHKYGQFYERYLSQILNNGGVNDSSYAEVLMQFTHDREMHEAYLQLSKKYGDAEIRHLEDELTGVVKRFKVFFPKRRTPARYATFMSGFNYNVVYVDSTIGIGLDQYLGADNDFYTRLQFPKFQSRTKDTPFIVPDVVRGWMITEFDNAMPVNTLLNHMIFYGKIYYACDALLPQVHDSLKIAYTGRQLDYCKTYEKELWGFLIKDNKLYDNNMKVIAEFTSDGPFTSAISKECPPRIAMWTGWQIVRAYMDRNPDVSLEQLMSENDAQKILTKSKYKP